MAEQPEKITEAQATAVADAMLTERLAAQRDARDRIEGAKTRPRRVRVLAFLSLVAAFFGVGSQ